MLQVLVGCLSLSTSFVQQIAIQFPVGIGLKLRFPLGIATSTLLSLESKFITNLMPLMVEDLFPEWCDLMVDF